MFIIFTIGRTGSSMLINILNNFEDVTFSGEIYNIKLLKKMNSDEEFGINDFEVFTDKAILMTGKTSKNPLFFPRNTNYYKNFYNPKKFLTGFMENKTRLEKLKYLMPLNKIVGCKILANSKVIKDFLKHYKNITTHFKIILLIRNNTDALRNSMKRAGFNSYKYVNLEEENLEYKKINEENEGIYLLSYEDILNRNKKFKDLFNFIGVKYDDRRVSQKFSEVCSYASRRDLFK